ncbi:hypothetical protein CSKR_112949 [Clonorchis sinensis]|uniref:Uncharacterized protein n=1 Tax=Clonorchis sinensis TaxID=79923 RepID=A0A3R7C8L3_CLOSI|nr:hypothetical protein CSKR_112949 [Clonorchis sinensis]
MSRDSPIWKQIWSCEKLTWNQGKSLVYVPGESLTKPNLFANECISLITCNLISSEIRGLCLPDEPKEVRNRL